MNLMFGEKNKNKNKYLTRLKIVFLAIWGPKSDFGHTPPSSAVEEWSKVGVRVPANIENTNRTLMEHHNHFFPIQFNTNFAFRKMTKWRSIRQQFRVEWLMHEKNQSMNLYTCTWELEKRAIWRHPLRKREFLKENCLLILTAICILYDYPGVTRLRSLVEWSENESNLE